MNDEESKDEQQIRELIAEWMRATAHGDLDALWDLMTPDVVFLLPGKPPLRGREEFADRFRSMPPGMRVDGISEIHEVAVSGELASVWAQLSVRITGADGGGEVAESGSTLSVFRKGGGGRWRLFRDANLLT